MIGRQLLKGDTSPGAHFRESLRARSKADYVAKLNGGLMELEERLYWLGVVEGAPLVSSEKLHSLEQETSELIAIFVPHQQVEENVAKDISAFRLLLSDLK